MTAFAMEQDHFEIGIAPIADAFAATVYSDVVSMKNHDRVRFIVFWGVGATGTTTLTIEACDDVVPTTVSAVPFTYRRLSAAGQAPGAPTAVAATGILTIAGSAQIYECEVAAAALLASGYAFARLKAVEAVDSPILGGVLIQMLKPRHATRLATATA